MTDSHLEDLADQIRALTVRELAELNRLITRGGGSAGAGVREPLPTRPPTRGANAEPEDETAA